VLAGKLFANIPKGSARAFVTRMVYDWHWTGLNQCKSSDSMECATCKLCGKGIEDQKHIACFCEEPNMRATRETHKKFIASQLELTVKSNSQGVRTRIHKVLTNPNNYELLFGRVHTHHLQQLDDIPSPKPGSETIALTLILQQLKLYAAMMIDLYRVRQLLLDSVPLAPIHIDHQRNLFLSQELMMGTASHHFLHSTGKKVTSAIDHETTTIQISSKRQIIDASNSLLVKKIRANESRQEAELEKQNNKKLCQKISMSEHTEWNIKHWNQNEEPPPIQPPVMKLTPTNPAPKDIAPIDLRPSLKKMQELFPDLVTLQSSPTSSTNNTSCPHHGPKWYNNSCASDSIIFVLTLLIYHGPNTKLIDSINPDLTQSIQNIIRQHLSCDTWHHNIGHIRHILLDNPTQSLRGQIITISDLIPMIFPNTKPSHQESHPTTTIINAHYTCTHHHMSTHTLRHKFIALHPPTIRSTLEQTISDKLITSNRQQRKCKISLCSHDSTLQSTDITIPEYLLLNFTDQDRWPHTHQSIPLTLQLSINNNQIQVLILKSIIYHNLDTNHFMTASIHNNDISFYDGMINNGETHQTPLISDQNQLKYNMRIKNSNWKSNFLIYHNQSSNLSPVLQITTTTPSNNHTINSGINQPINNNNPNRKRSNNHLHVYNESNLNNVYNTVYNNNNITHNSCSNNNNSSNSNTCMYNPDNVNNNLYPILDPPKITVIDNHSESRKKLRSPSQEAQNMQPKKRTAHDYVTLEPPTQRNSKRLKRCCSPGTAEGPSGQG
jgi:hypothetical protein